MGIILIELVWIFYSPAQILQFNEPNICKDKIKTY